LFIINSLLQWFENLQKKIISISLSSSLPDYKGLNVWDELIKYMCEETREVEHPNKSAFVEELDSDTVINS
jgi:hypothetical protein